MSDKYKNKRYLIEVGNVLILSSHLQFLLLYFLPLIQPVFKSWMEYSAIMCLKPPSGIPTAPGQTLSPVLLPYLCRGCQNEGKMTTETWNVEILVIFHVNTRRLGHTFTFFPTTKDNISNTQLSKHKPETADSQENKNSHKQNTMVMVECSMFLLLCQLLAVLSNYTAFWFWTRFEWVPSSYTQRYQISWK